jgi:hypothetical protein
VVTPYNSSALKEISDCETRRPITVNTKVRVKWQASLANITTSQFISLVRNFSTIYVYTLLPSISLIYFLHN